MLFPPYMFSQLTDRADSARGHKETPTTGTCNRSRHTSEFVRELSRLSTRCPSLMIRPLVICGIRLMRELTGSIVPSPLLVSSPIHPGAINRTNHMFPPVLLLSIQERCNSKKNRSDKNDLPHPQFHLVPLSLVYFRWWMRQESAQYASMGNLPPYAPKSGCTKYSAKTKPTMFGWQGTSARRRARESGSCAAPRTGGRSTLPSSPASTRSTFRTWSAAHASQDCVPSARSPLLSEQRCRTC